MDLNITEEPSKANAIKKKLFKVKPTRRDGLFLTIHYHRSKNGPTRFSRACFNNTGRFLAITDNNGRIYIVDFLEVKFWDLTSVEACSGGVTTFSQWKSADLLVGTSQGVVDIVDVNTGQLSGKLWGHSQPVVGVSFATEKEVCLTATQEDAIVWNLTSNCKLQVLNLEANCNLKFVLFMPVSNNILACFQDDIIQIWKYKTLEGLKQFTADNWSNFSVRHIEFTRNGNSMIIVGYLPTIAIFSLNHWKLTKLIRLPDHVLSVRHAEFVPECFDGGSNKILAILTGQGVVYFYNIEKNVILSELATDCEINRLSHSLKGDYLACVLSSGEINIYKTSQYTCMPLEVKVERAQKITAGSRLSLRRNSSKIVAVKEQMDKLLEIDKLKAILREFGEYPQAHRLKIWETLLELPQNQQEYNSIINHMTIVAFQNLYEKYPLDNKNIVKSLKLLLNNIVTWCPFFAHVDYLPVFAFPFVKLFQNKPLVCFEALCTIILNWCQHWFEYYPLPPVNVLAMVDNVLLEHDPDVLQHFSLQQLSPTVYIWPLLETAFSEVLITNEWLHFWDHVLSNEPAFLLCAAVAYLVLHRNLLLSFTSLEQFEFFFHHPNPTDIKQFIGKTTWILDNTSISYHPRQYLHAFSKLDVGKYPAFLRFPRTIVEYEHKQREGLQNEFTQIQHTRGTIDRSRAKDLQKLRETEIANEEAQRQIQMERACMEKILKEREKVKQQREHLETLRKALMNEENEILNLTKMKLVERQVQDQQKDFEIMLGGLELGELSERNLQKIHDELLQRYSQLVKHKIRVQHLLQDDKPGTVSIIDNKDFDDVQKIQVQLDEELLKVKNKLLSENELKKLNIQTGIAAMDALMYKIQNELTLKSQLEPRAHLRVMSLQSETKALENEITELLKLLCQNRQISSDDDGFTESRSFDESSRTTPPKSFLTRTSTKTDEIGSTSRRSKDYGWPKNNIVVQNVQCYSESDAGCSKTVRFGERLHSIQR